MIECSKQCENSSPRFALGSFSKYLVRLKVFHQDCAHAILNWHFFHSSSLCHRYRKRTRSHTFFAAPFPTLNQTSSACPRVISQAAVQRKCIIAKLNWIVSRRMGKMTKATVLAVFVQSFVLTEFIWLHKVHLLIQSKFFNNYATRIFLLGSRLQHAWATTTTAKNLNGSHVSCSFTSHAQSPPGANPEFQGWPGKKCDC